MSEPIKMSYEIAEFLTKNGFDKITDNLFRNDKCDVSATKDGYEVWFNDWTWYMHDPNIYQLVGFLTWNDLMDKNYKNI